MLELKNVSKNNQMWFSLILYCLTESWDVYISDSVTAATRGKVFNYIYNSNVEAEGYLSFV